MMEDQEHDKGYGIAPTSGLCLSCHNCGKELPLLHPHIMVEKNDKQGNIICEECYNSL